MTAFSAVLERTVGDDWTVSGISLTDAKSPADLTGCVVSAVVYTAGSTAPLAVLGELDRDGIGGLTVASDRTSGRITELWLSYAITTKIKGQDPREREYLTRVAILVTDSAQRTRTFLIIPFRPLDRQTEPFRGPGL